VDGHEASPVGHHVALLGIDGAGKSSLVRELAGLARERGIPVQAVSWRGFIEQGGQAGGYPLEELRRLWVRSFRLYFAGGTKADGSALDLPASYEDLNTRGGTEYLNGLVVTGQVAAGPLASAWIELAANTILHREVIGPLRGQGYLVLQESYGYKHLLKLLSYAERLSDPPGRLTDYCHELIRKYFGSYLRPDVGLWVSTPPELALRWRLGQAGRLGTFETYATMGADPHESFLQVQAESAARFEEFAASFGWMKVAMVDAGVDINRATALRALRATALRGPLGLDSDSQDDAHITAEASG